MKKTLVILTIAVCGIATAPTAATTQQQDNCVAVNPLGIFLLGVQNVEYERVLSPNTGIAIYWAMSGSAPAEIFDVRMSGSEQRVSYRHYPSGCAPKGNWIGGSLAYSSGDISETDGNSYAYDLSMIVLSVEAGHRWISGSFNIAPIVMLRMPLTDDLLGTKQDSGNVSIPFGVFAIGINIGWGW